MTDLVVFLGPTLPIEEARQTLDATYRPPAALGDVYRALDSGVRAIAIVDGSFDSVPAVRHKEILLALSRGVRVYGAASMGALRAVEIERFGMVGIGEVFRLFRDGVLEDDDEVAVVHGPAEAGYRPGSEALVNIRHGLDRAVIEGTISPSTQPALIDLAKRRFYADRSWSTLIDDGRATGLPVAELENLSRLVRAVHPDVKRKDAVALLRRLGADRLAGWPASAREFRFEPAPQVLHTLIDDAGVALTDEFRASCSAIARIADARPDATAIRNDALALYALAREASQGHRLPTWLEAYESMFVQRAETQAVAALERRIADLTAALLDEGDIWIDLFVPAAMARRGVLTEALAQLRTENQ